MENEQTTSQETQQEENSQNQVLPEQPKKFAPPAGIMAKIYCNHFGIILSNLAIVACCFAAFSFIGVILSALLPVFYYIFLLALTVLSWGATFAYIPNFTSWWHFDTNISESLTFAFANAIPYLSAIVFASAIASIVLLVLDKNNRHWGRFATSIVLMVISAFIVLFWALGGTK
ncbi:MAG: hypothetical protein J6J24_04470 [Clostridia bacterium]|nr:hypothetical protein [Clostridia bacterium]